jgi:hypothetical protein
MLPYKRSLATSLSYFLDWTSLHTFIASPRPIEGSAPKDPLTADGSNFPCHGVALPVDGGQQLTAGLPFELKLDIGAGGENNAVYRNFRGELRCLIQLQYIFRFLSKSFNSKLHRALPRRPSELPKPPLVPFGRYLT